MSGSITHASNWNSGIEQQYLAVIPAGDEVLLYQTNSSAKEEEKSLVKLYSRAGFNQVQCISYSPMEKGLTAVGQIDGTISLFDITNQESALLKLKPKQSRPCNTLSLNNGGLIAAGFDKSRQENSIQIWDIEHYFKGSKNEQNVKKPTHSYIPYEAINSVVFDPNLPTNLLAGSYKFLREIDLRTDSPVFQLATRCTSGIVMDPFDANYFSSFSEDGTLSVWDKRKLTALAKISYNANGATAIPIIAEAPALHYHKLLNDSSRKSLSPCFRYSNIRKGEFSAVFGGDYIRRWQIGTVPPIKRPESKLQSSSNQGSGSPLFKPDETSLFVSSVLDVKTTYERVISYDYSPNIYSKTSSCLVCMRQSGSVFRMNVTESFEGVMFNSFNEITLCGPSGTYTRFADESEESRKQNKQNKHPNNSALIETNLMEKDNVSEVTVSTELNDQPDNSEVDYDYEEELEKNVNKRRNRARSLTLSTSYDVFDVLNNDIASIMRKRALIGYGVDCEKNVNLFEDSAKIESQWFLRNTWNWLLLAKKSLDKGYMIAENLDLGFQGVLGLWNGASGLINQNRYLKTFDVGEDTFSNAIKSIISSKGQKSVNISVPGVTEKKLQRKLCLIVAGWDFGDNELDQKLNNLISMERYEKAAGWAVFHGNVSKAVDILASAKNERLRIISTAVSGYLAYRNSSVNSPWKDRCRKMANELDDPYLRAIFAFIADNNWQDVLNENALPLRERLGVALKFLPDKDLTIFLNEICEKVIKGGELEGIIVTGITPQGIDLLQSYVDRTSDVQTASLIASFGCPRYFEDSRVQHWVDSYRTLLNSWSLFNVRAKFDVARTKLSKTHNGQVTIKTAPRQLYLQCIRCNKNLSKPKNNTVPSANLRRFTKNPIPNKKEFTACSYCGAPLPRCAICLLPLGKPIPSENAFPGSTVGTPETAVYQNNQKQFKEWFSFCMSCNHSSHAIHAEEWFSKHYVCPVPDCNCRCNSR